MKLKVGDTIVGYEKYNDGIERTITEVRQSGYTWKYANDGFRDYWSENSSDPFFDWGWKLKIIN